MNARANSILFPTRGGKASYPNQDRVIALAQEMDARLIFMYVSDVRFLSLMARPVVADLEERLEEMGEFILAMAQERAAVQDVQAVTVVRQGVFREALKSVIREQNVDVLAIGAPAESGGLTTPRYRHELVEELQQERSLRRIIVLKDGEIFEEYEAPGAAAGT